MFPLFETIKIYEKKIYNFEHHLARMQHSIKVLSGRNLQFKIQESEILEKINTNELYKCRLRYNESTFDIELEKYKKRTISEITLIEENAMSYPLKFVDRECFLKHTKTLPKQTEPIFVVDDLLTDSSFSNIALWNGNEWHTPKNPLFFGIKRTQLVENKIIIEKEIVANEIQQYKKIAFINAMLDLGELEVLIE